MKLSTILKIGSLVSTIEKGKQEPIPIPPWDKDIIALVLEAIDGFKSLIECIRSFYQTMPSGHSSRIEDRLLVLEAEMDRIIKNYMVVYFSDKITGKHTERFRTNVYSLVKDLYKFTRDISISKANFDLIA